MASPPDPKSPEIELELDIPSRVSRPSPKAKSERVPDAPLEIALDYGTSNVSSGSLPTTVRSPQKAPSHAHEAREQDDLVSARRLAQYGEDPRGVFASMRYVVDVYRRRKELVNQLAQSQARVVNFVHTRDATLVSIGTRARQATLGVDSYLDLHELIGRTERTAATQQEHYAAIEQGHLAELRTIDANLAALENAYQDAAREQQAAAHLAAELQRECDRLDAKQKRVSIELRNVATNPSAPPPSLDTKSISDATSRAIASFNEAVAVAQRAASIADERKAQWQRAQTERTNRQATFARATAPVTQAMGQMSQERTQALCALARRALDDASLRTPEWTIAMSDLSHQDQAVTTAEAHRDQIKLAIDSYDPIGLRRGIVAWTTIAATILLLFASIILWRAW